MKLYLFYGTTFSYSLPNLRYLTCNLNSTTVLYSSCHLIRLLNAIKEAYFFRVHHLLGSTTIVHQLY